VRFVPAFDANSKGIALLVYHPVPVVIDGVGDVYLLGAKARFFDRLPGVFQVLKQGGGM
jgi:hypothetical protein